MASQIRTTPLAITCFDPATIQNVSSNIPFKKASRGGPQNAFGAFLAMTRA